MYSVSCTRSEKDEKARRNLCYACVCVVVQAYAFCIVYVSIFRRMKFIRRHLEDVYENIFLS